MNDKVIYPHIMLMQRDTNTIVKMYDIVDLVVDNGNHQTIVKGKLDQNGTPKKVTMYNTRVMYKEEKEAEQ